jgi:hypothetical protein
MNFCLASAKNANSLKRHLHIVVLKSFYLKKTLTNAQIVKKCFEVDV